MYDHSSNWIRHNRFYVYLHVIYWVVLKVFICVGSWMCSGFHQALRDKMPWRELVTWITSVLFTLSLWIWSNICTGTIWKINVIAFGMHSVIVPDAKFVKWNIMSVISVIQCCSLIWSQILKLKTWKDLLMSLVASLKSSMAPFMDTLFRPFPFCGLHCNRFKVKADNRIMLINVLSLFGVYYISTVQIFSIVHGVMHVTLNVRYRGTELNINEELIRLNYADRAEESYSSMVCMFFWVL